MDATGLLDKIPLWGVFLASLTITFLSMEFGFRAGKRKRRSLTGEKEIQAGPFVAASLSLLAFMLAIAFGNAQSRVHEVKQVALDEANAIGTAYLRADLLPAAERAEIRQLLYDYVSLRIEAVEAGTQPQFEQASDRAEAIQINLWSRAATFADQRPTPIAALVVASVNDLIDLYEMRIALAFRYRLPGIIWPVLFGVAILAMAMGGYATGLTGSRQFIAITLSAASVFSVVLLVVVSLDRPQEHLERITLPTMLDLQESIRSSMQSQP
jgi:hypothetical protein